MSHFEKAERTDKARLALDAHNYIWPVFGYRPYDLSADSMGLSMAIPRSTTLTPSNHCAASQSVDPIRCLRDRTTAANAVAICTLIQPQAYIAHDWPAARWLELMPWNWQPVSEPSITKAAQTAAHSPRLLHPSIQRMSYLKPSLQETNAVLSQAPPRSTGPSGMRRYRAQCG